MFCPNCNMWVEEPSVHTPGREWMNFHAGRCPKCEAGLLNAPPSRGENTNKLKPSTEAVSDNRDKKKSSGFLGKFFGGTNRTEGETTIVTGGHKLGPIGEKRLNIAANHVCQQIQQRFQKSVKKLSASTSLDVGLCLITITTRKGTEAGLCKQIGDSANSLLDTEVEYQHYIDDLISLIGEHDVSGTGKEFLGSAREDARAIGQNIYNHSGLAGMTYICSILGELWPHTGLMRSLEVAWNGIGSWSS